MARTCKGSFLKLLVCLPLAAAIFSSSGLQAEEETKKTPQVFKNSQATGGMTYSPTQGWVKTSDQINVGTDALVYENQKKIIAAAVKKNREKMAKEKAEAAAKAKAEKEAAEAVPNAPQATPTYKSRVYIS